MTYSRDFRERVLKTRQEDKLTIAEVAKRFKIAIASVVRWDKVLEAKRTRHKIKHYKQANKPIIYIDESGFAHDMPRRFGYAPQNSVIVMDNATFHKRQDIQQAIWEAGHILEYLPPYSPDLNPIEHQWAQAKALRKQQNCSIDELFLRYSILSASN